MGQLLILAKPRETHPRLEPFLVSPFLAIFMEGESRYPDFVLARREKLVLFAAVDTRRFGVASFDDTTREATDASQYPEFDLAARRFLGDIEPRDRDWLG